MNREQKKKYDLIIKLINKECHPNIIIENLDDLMDSFENQHNKIAQKLDKWHDSLLTNKDNTNVRNDMLRFKEEITSGEK